MPSPAAGSWTGAPRPTRPPAGYPGDDLLEAADVVATRAITIDAPPSAIWPWLIQMGPGRGGVYTYDWIENLFGLDMHSADEIVPEWQSLEVGYTWRNPQGKGMRVDFVDRERAIVLRAEDGGWVWALVLAPEGERTRFLSRNRFRLTGGLLSRLASTYLMLELVAAADAVVPADRQEPAADALGVGESIPELLDGGVVVALPDIRGTRTRATLSPFDHGGASWLRGAADPGMPAMRPIAGRATDDPRPRVRSLRGARRRCGR